MTKSRLTKEEGLGEPGEGRGTDLPAAPRVLEAAAGTGRDMEMLPGRTGLKMASRGPY